MDYGNFIFLVGCIIVLHTYILYPVIVSIWSKFFSLKTENEPLKIYPPVTLLIPGHNIEHLIEMKIDNLMKLKYQGELTLMFVLDGCTDRTEAKIKDHVNKDNKYPITIYSNPKRYGKEAAINGALDQVMTEVLVFSDADAILNNDCVERLVTRLMQDGIGAVSGREIHEKNSDEGASEGQGLFYKYEEFIKGKLTAVGSLPYIQGGNFAMMRKLYPQNIPEGCTQDGIIAFDVVRQGYRVAYEPSAISSEEYNLTSQEDFDRRVRTIGRAFFSVLCRPQVLNPFKTGSYFYHILSGRILRWLTLPIMLVTFLSGLLSSSFLMNLIVFCGGICGLLFVLLGFIIEKREWRRLKFPYFCYYFFYIHLAAAKAIFNVSVGARTTTWTPSN